MPLEWYIFLMRKNFLIFTNASPVSLPTFRISSTRTESLSKEPLNRSVLLRRSRSGEILRRHRDSFCPLSLTLSYLFVALMPFLRPFLHNRRNTPY